MPITAKLSRKFYEKLGDDLANELVEWLNLVDTSYRQEFKDLFDANFRRLESELGGLQVRLESEMAGLRERLESQMAALREHVESQMAALRSEMGRLRESVDARLGGFEGVMNARFAALEDRLDAKLEKQKSSLLFWNFVFCVGTVGAVLAMLKL